MWKVLYLIPWFTEQIHEERYHNLINVLKSKDIKIVPILIDRKYKTMSDYVYQAISQINKHKSWDIVSILWFSFGAVISYIISSQTDIIDTQYLCSLSPYFQEDLDHIPQRRKRFMGKKRIQDFQSISSSLLAKNISAHTYLLYWTQEHPAVATTSIRISNDLQNHNIIAIPWGKHDISQAVYHSTIETLLSQTLS